MKKVLMLILMFASALTEAQVQTPSPSPGAVVSTVVGLTDVKVEYSRPKAKGRKIFGTGPEFVTPYGDIWRTGANNGCKITFSDDVKFGGSAVPKGTYLVLTIPGATEWTVILSKDMTLAGAGNNPVGYDLKNDQARAMVKSEKLTEKVETFTIEIADIAENSKSANLQLLWENTSVKVPITVDFDAKVMKSIEASTKVNPGSLYQAATYYYENGKDMKQALEWITTASASNANAFWMSHLKAKIQKSMGDKAGAMASAMASKKVAEAEKNADYVKMNDELMKGLK